MWSRCPRTPTTLISLLSARTGGVHHDTLGVIVTQSCQEDNPSQACGVYSNCNVPEKSLRQPGQAHKPELG